MTAETETPELAEPSTRPRPRQHTPEEVAAIIAKQGPKSLSTYDALLGAGVG